MGLWKKWCQYVDTYNKAHGYIGYYEKLSYAAPFIPLCMAIVSTAIVLLVDYTMWKTITMDVFYFFLASLLISSIGYAFTRVAY